MCFEEAKSIQVRVVRAGRCLDSEKRLELRPHGRRARGGDHRTGGTQHPRACSGEPVEAVGWETEAGDARADEGEVESTSYRSGWPDLDAYKRRLRGEPNKGQQGSERLEGGRRLLEQHQSLGSRLAVSSQQPCRALSLPAAPCRSLSLPVAPCRHQLPCTTPSLLRRACDPSSSNPNVPRHPQAVPMVSLPNNISHPWAPLPTPDPLSSAYNPHQQNPRVPHFRGWLASFAPSLRTLPLSEKHPWETTDPSVASSIRTVRRWARHRLPSFHSPVFPPLPSPTAVRFVLLCALWYTTSALSSNTGKVILTHFRYPITLTFIQFGFVAAFCLLFMSPLVHFSKFKRPSRAIFRSTIPMGLFQVGGHIFSSMAISRIPVSTVHTIKALSPLFTVAAYALLFRVRYSPKTYLSLLPLTLGVILASSFEMKAGNVMGLLCAFGSAIVFVTSNIFFKKIMPSNGGSTSHKLDKLNLLFYSSSMAFVLMIPIWAYYDLPLLLAAAADSAYVSHPPHDGGVHGSHFHSIAQHVLANGTVHFAQNIIAFILLAQTSPVTYSIASLIKRVAVIVIALVWFAQSVHPVQGVGIALTFGGLYLYNRAKTDVEQGETRMRRVNAARDMALPTTQSDAIMDPSAPLPTVIVDAPPAETAFASAYGRPGGYAHIYPTAAAAGAHPPPPLPAPAPAPAPALPGYSHTHPHPNLHIKITPPPPPPPIGAGKPSSPVDSYPSPPPSLDSPPLSHPAWGARRGSMATGHPPPHAVLEAHSPRATAAA